MTLRLRQVAFVAADLAPVEQEITDKLGVQLCFRDPGVGAFGLVNALFPIGDKLLEVVSPNEDGTTAGRLLDKRGGDGGYMVLLQTDELDAMRARFDEQGARVIHTATAPGIIGLHLHPRDIGGAIVSVDETDEWAEWPWAGPTWREHVATDVVSDLVGVAIQAEDPEAMADRWAAVLGREVTVDGGEPQIVLDEGLLRFTPIEDGRGEGVSEIDVTATDGKPGTVEVCGVRVNLLGVAP